MHLKWEEEVKMEKLSPRKVMECSWIDLGIETQLCHLTSCVTLGKT